MFWSKILLIFLYSDGFLYFFSVEFKAKLTAELCLAYQNIQENVIFQMKTKQKFATVDVLCQNPVFCILTAFSTFYNSRIIKTTLWYLFTVNKEQFNITQISNV